MKMQSNHQWLSKAAVVLLTLSSAVTVALAADKVMYMNAAGDAFKRNDFRQCAGLVSKAIDYGDRSRDAYFMRAMCLTKLESYEDALKDFKTGFAKPGVEAVNCGVYDVEADCYIGLNDLKSAMACVDRAISVQPLSIFWRKKGQIYCQLKDYDGAIKCFTEAIKLSPRAVWAFRERADSYAVQKKYKEALADYNALIKLNPKEPAGYGGRAKIYEKLGMKAEAKRDYDAANSNSDFPF
jgi:tetratricopeptide (TPR) repeat protein